MTIHGAKFNLAPQEMIFVIIIFKNAVAGRRVCGAISDLAPRKMVLVISFICPVIAPFQVHGAILILAPRFLLTAMTGILFYGAKSDFAPQVLGAPNRKSLWHDSN
jgi:hypothetical protein